MLLQIQLFKYCIKLVFLGRIFFQLFLWQLFFLIMSSNSCNFIYGRQCYTQPHVFLGLYETSWYREVWTTKFLGYYHVSFEWDHDTNQCRAIIWFVGFVQPINAIPTYIAGHEEYRVRIFTQTNTPERIRHDLVEFGPWSFIKPNVVSRRLHF